MQFEQRLRDGVRTGRITCSVRIWMRPHVKVGGRYRMEEGEIEAARSMTARKPRRAVVVLLALAAACVPASLGADMLLHPTRKPVTRQPTIPFEAVTFEGAGVTLKGWWFRSAEKRGTVVLLHGISDNREAGLGPAQHFTARGFDLIAYDSRAHGESGGDLCTYGFHEKQDLRRVLDRVAVKPIIAMGFSMGAAIALQAAADDARIAAVVAVSPFSDLRTIVNERAPFFASRRNIAAAFRVAEEKAQFRADEVSAVAAAARISVPTLIIHGDRDDETTPDHSQRIFAALREPKRLILVPGAGHNHVLNEGVWREIDAWLETALAPAAARPEAR